MTPALLPDRNPQSNFFIADIFDSLQFKDDRHTMEHPFFTLSTKKDIRTMRYEKDGISVVLSPSAEYGLPTMMDKDILLYCGSLVMSELNKLEKSLEREASELALEKKRTLDPSLSYQDIEQHLTAFKERYKQEQYMFRSVPRTLRFSCHDLLITTNRHTNSVAYQHLKKAFERLKGVSVTTNIKTNNMKHAEGFGLIDSWRIIEKNHDNRRMVRIEVTLSEWLYYALLGKEVLSIHPHYFRLRKPLERRLYEIARKHCGKQETWSIGLQKLYDKTGSQSVLKKFRFQIRDIIKTNNEQDHFPDYHINYDAERDIVSFHYRHHLKAMVSSMIGGLKLRETTLHQAFELVNSAGTGWDIHNLVNEYVHYIQKKGVPEKLDAAFLGFIRKKVKKSP